MGDLIAEIGNLYVVVVNASVCMYDMYVMYGRLCTFLSLRPLNKAYYRGTTVGQLHSACTFFVGDYANCGYDASEYKLNEEHKEQFVTNKQTARTSSISEAFHCKIKTGRVVKRGITDR